jgi:hypothetical protein
MKYQGELREKRNKLLEETDWVATLLITGMCSNIDEWLEYRQALRDLPEVVYQKELGTGQPIEDPIFPIPPTKKTNT